MLLSVLKKNQHKFSIPRIEKPLFYEKCIDYPYVDRYGYGMFQFRHDGIKCRILAHRAAFMLHNNCELASEEIVMHSCDNPACVNPNHLKKGTTEDNVLDRVKKKRSARGKNNGRFAHGNYVGRYERLKNNQ